MKIKVLLVAAFFVFAIAGATCADDSVYNVKDFGAKGDGVTDDTQAFISALEKATADYGGTVKVPRGRYVITKTITVDKCFLVGSETGGWNSDHGFLPTILVRHKDGPCILAKEGASICGLNFEYAMPGNGAEEYGPTILLSGVGISIENLRMHAPYEGIMADDEMNVGRLNIENVFIVSARECGVYVSKTFDIPTIRNVEVWNTDGYSFQHCTGFRFAKNDEMRVTDCFAFGCNIGYHFVTDPTDKGDYKGKTWGGLTGCSSDFCSYGVVVENVQSLRINGGSFWSHWKSLDIIGPGPVVISGADIRSNGDSAVVLDGCDSVTITGCAIGKNGPGWPDVPAVRLKKANNVLINGCSFDGMSKGVHISKDADNFMITNCVFKPSPYEAIIDESSEDATKIVKDNLAEKVCGE